MSRKKFLLKLAILFLLNISIIVCFQNLSGAKAAVYRQGSHGDAVREIQERLIRWGYLSGTADGIYGAATKEAVASFQQANGLSPDGVCGTQTLSALGITESSTAVSDSGGNYARNDDLYLLSRIISAESRGEVYQGQVAVGAVVLNRTKHPSFPDTVAGVIYQPGAFSSISDGQFYEEISDSAKRAAQDALNGMDPSGGAIYFYNPAKTTSAWIYSRPVIKTIGKHVFAE